MKETGRTDPSNTLKNVAAGLGRCGFTSRSAKLQPLARPQIPLSAENACLTDKVGRSSSQTARHMGNVGLNIGKSEYTTLRFLNRLAFHAAICSRIGNAPF
jgi:hypothetical protein